MPIKAYSQDTVIRLVDHAAILRQRDERHAAELAIIQQLGVNATNIAGTLSRVEANIAYVDVPQPMRGVVLDTLYNLADDLTDALHWYDKCARRCADVFGVNYELLAQALTIAEYSDLRTALLNVREDNGRSVVDWCRLNLYPGYAKFLVDIRAGIEALKVRSDAYSIEALKRARDIYIDTSDQTPPRDYLRHEGNTTRRRAWRFERAIRNCNNFDAEAVLRSWCESDRQMRRDLERLKNNVWVLSTGEFPDT